MFSKRNPSIQATRLATTFKRPYLFHQVDKVKLWPSKRGILHGVKEAEDLGSLVRITTHCGMTIIVKSSRRSRAARWLRNRWMKVTCPVCVVPKWKIERFARSAS